MTKFVRDTLPAQHKGVDNPLLAALEQLIKCNVEKRVRSPQTYAEIAVVIIDNRRFITLIAALVKSEQQ